MTDSNFLSGEIVPTNIVNRNQLIPIGREPQGEKGGALVYNPQEQEYGRLEQIAPEEFLYHFWKILTLYR